VDPDNRRLVDYPLRRTLLAAHDQGSPANGLDAEKLLVTARALRLRREHPDWFADGYTPLHASGPAAGHALAFRRGQAVTVVTRLPAGLRDLGGWAGTALEVPAGRWRDVLTGTTRAGPYLLLSDLAVRLPVTLLIPDGA